MAYKWGITYQLLVNLDDPPTGGIQAFEAEVRGVKGLEVATPMGGDKCQAWGIFVHTQIFEMIANTRREFVFFGSLLSFARNRA